MEEKTRQMVKSSKESSGLTKREFVRKVIVGGVVIFVAGGGYVRPELETYWGLSGARNRLALVLQPAILQQKLRKSSKKLASNKMFASNK